MKKIFFYLCKVFENKERMSGGVIGNTSDFGSEESRFEPWPDNKKLLKAAFFDHGTF